MKWLAVLGLLILAGCGTNARSEYLKEAAVLDRLEGELGQAEGKREMLTADIRFMGEQIAERKPGEPLIDIVGHTEKEVTEDEMRAMIEDRQEKLAAADKRVAELQPRVDAQRNRVKELEESL